MGAQNGVADVAGERKRRWRMLVASAKEGGGVSWRAPTRWRMLLAIANGMPAYAHPCPLLPTLGAHLCPPMPTYLCPRMSTSGAHLCPLMPSCIHMFGAHLCPRKPARVRSDGQARCILPRREWACAWAMRGAPWALRVLARVAGEQQNAQASRWQKANCSRESLAKTKLLTRVAGEHQHAQASPWAKHKMLTRVVVKTKRTTRT